MTFCNQQWSVGSRWVRIDPHLHAPGTLQNDQFQGDWDGYITRINNAVPQALVLGVTDYFSLRCYQEVRRRWLTGEMPHIKLVFPNIELRLNLKVSKGSAVNIHILIDPSDKDHVQIIQEKLSSLTFSYQGDQYGCSETELVRLGRRFSQNENLPDASALKVGVSQFKVEFQQLQGLRNRNAWVQRNVLFAVAGGGDGISGIGRDDAFEAHREEIGRIADIIFSSGAKDRSFWSGGHEGFTKLGVDPKPCLHGSDAHALDTVLAPAENRRCWIRASPSFEGIRQTLAEPLRRVHIGEFPPPRPLEGETISRLLVENAPWFTNMAINFNDGLTTIIGPRGSGKTALTDLIAFATGSLPVSPGSASFFAKAKTLLKGMKVTVEWGDGLKKERVHGNAYSGEGEPTVRYLSQQFVEELCSNEATAESLGSEIERVVFSAIPEEDRRDAGNFTGLKSLVLRSTYSTRAHCKELIRGYTKQISEENSLVAGLAKLRSDLQECKRQLEGTRKELQAIPVSTEPSKRKALEGILQELSQLKREISAVEKNESDISSLRSSVAGYLASAREEFSAWRESYPALLSEVDWALLLPRIDPLGEGMLAQKQQSLKEKSSNARIHGLAVVRDEWVVGMSSRGIAFLNTETERLTKELGADPVTVKRRTELTKRIQDLTTQEAKLVQQIAHAEQSKVRIGDLRVHRLETYKMVFETYEAETAHLDSLYSALHSRVNDQTAFGKMTFAVKRVVDIKGWADKGEALIDLRKASKFQGKGALESVVREKLLVPWESGSVVEVVTAIREFAEIEPWASILARGITPVELGDWLFSTDHICVQYRILYEGVELQRLSPGARGAVLLMLYLGLDEWDRRPVIIDQPEDNLDPQSVYRDLVQYFRTATTRRQVIMVTHNANLVVNTDSDQVIVAQSKRTGANFLPQISYVTGGLEDDGIKEMVCNLLEGGEEAFKRRSKRYGVGPQGS